MQLWETLSQIGLIPVVFNSNTANCVEACKAILKGGINAVLFSDAQNVSSEIIQLIHSEIPEMLIGIGNIQNCDQADYCINAGARFISSLLFDNQLNQYCLSKNYPYLPGCATPSEIRASASSPVIVYPVENPSSIKKYTAAIPDVRLAVADGITLENMNLYLSIPQVSFCFASWIATEEDINSHAWDRITEKTREAIRVMLGLQLFHIGINHENATDAKTGAERLAALLDWSIPKNNETSMFVGEGFEMMKTWFRGTHGHISIGTKNLERARWYLERRGFLFDDTTIKRLPDGRICFIYIQEEISGFAIHLSLMQ